MVGLRPQIALPGLQSKTPAQRLCRPGATSPKPRALLLPPLGGCSFAPARWGCASRYVGIAVPLPSMAGGGGHLRDLPERLRVPSSADGRGRGHLASPGEDTRGVPSGGCRWLLFAQMHQVLSHLAACWRGSHRTTHRQHLRGGPGQARESHAHQSTGSASTNNPGSRLGADRARADVHQQLFPIIKNSRIHQKSQGREGVLASGEAAAEPTHPLQLSRL